MVNHDIVMVRHGESQWNEKNLFCGWYDADLNEKGKDEAMKAGKALKDANYKFDCAHTSVLTRAKKSLETILGVTGQVNIPVYETWRLNERHYGGLTGLNKSETAMKYGETQVCFVPALAGFTFVRNQKKRKEANKNALLGQYQDNNDVAMKYDKTNSLKMFFVLSSVQIWRRSYDVPPPMMEKDHPYYNEIVNDPRYAKGPSKEEFPMGESLKLTIERTMPYWDNVIVPQIKEGKTILIAAHGNSLRGIVKTLENMSEEAIMQLNLPTGIPFVYTLDENLKPVASMKFLGDEETVKKAIESVAAQGKAK